MVVGDATQVHRVPEWVLRFPHATPRFIAFNTFLFLLGIATKPLDKSAPALWFDRISLHGGQS